MSSSFSVPAIVVLLLVCASSVEAEFKSASSVEETRAMIEKLPTDDIWWVPQGEQMGWNFRNLHRFMPTVNVYRHGPVKELAININPAIASYPVKTPDGSMPFDKFLSSEHTRTMGVVVVRKGEIVFEAYPRQEPYEKPIYWSVTKVLVSGLVAILEDEGKIDVSKPIEFYIPALKSSSYKGITVRNILDMATGLDCPDEYEDKSSCYYRFSMTLGDGYWEESSPDNPYEHLSTLKADKYAEQGTSYSYSGVHTFVLAWLVETMTGMPFQDAVTKYLWRHMGAEHDASMLAPRYGVPLAPGGLMATLRDLARFGMLHTPSSTLLTDKPVFSERYINLLKTGGNPELIRNSRPEWPVPDNVKHNVYQWDLVYDNNDLYKGGWAGQGLIVNPDKDLVAVFTGYFAKEGVETIWLLPILREILNKTYPE